MKENEIQFANNTLVNLSTKFILHGLSHDMGLIPLALGQIKELSCQRSWEEISSQSPKSKET